VASEEVEGRDQRAYRSAREPAKPKTKRVYKTVSLVAADGRHHVHLDGKAAMTPLRNALAANARALGEALAAEWDAQDPFIDPENMPLTRLVATEVDRITPQRDAIIGALLEYVDTDVLCYRAPDRELKARQLATWQPVLDWLGTAHGVTFNSVEGVLPLTQSPTAAAKLKSAIAALDDVRLTAYQACAALTNSLALPLALVHGRLTAAQVYAAAYLDEIFQAEKWGEDAEARDRRVRIAADIEAIGKYLALSAL
jgi:chaperone required for assembly of F1-ATPase